MGDNKLTKMDYEKIFEFITKIQDIKFNFRNTVLNNISNIFGYNYLTFFLTDRRGKLINPIATNINPLLTQKYINYYHRTDIFCEENECNKLFEKDILSITDIMTYRQFEDTEYYKDFLSLDNLYYEIAIPLKIGKKLLGGIGTFRPKELGEFKVKDIVILKKLSFIISKSLNDYIRLKEVSEKKEIYKDIKLNAPVGIIILNNKNYIEDFNNKALEFCLDILKGEMCLDPIKYVIDKLLMQCKLTKKHSYLCGTMCNYDFKMISSIISNEFSGLKSFSYIYIIKKQLNNFEIFNSNILKYNLTNREIDIINLVSKGLSNKEIAEELFISCHTVKAHMENLLKKTNADNRMSLIYKINNVT